MTTTISAPNPNAPRPPRTRAKRPVRRFFIVTHRWISLILGIVLLAITTSGAILVYRPELQRALHPDAYAASHRAPTVDVAQARDVVLAAHPKYDALGVWEEHGVYRVTDYETLYTVDPGTGKILGHVGETPRGCS